MTSPTPPPGPPATVGIVAKTRLREAAGVVANLTDWLTARGVGVVVESDTARLVERQGPPTCSRDELPSAAELILVLESVLAGTARIDERRMLHSRVLRNEAVMADRTVLNDVVLGKAALSNIIDFAITLGEQFVMSSRADGLIIASPTGSTAYNLAAGGPIVHPTVDAVLLTPFAPHTLTNRPIVIPATAPVRVTPALGGAHQSAYVSFDGQYGFELAPGDSVTVERAARPLRVVRAESRSYFAVLREKLKWGER